MPKIESLLKRFDTLILVTICFTCLREILISRLPNDFHPFNMIIIQSQLQFHQNSSSLSAGFIPKKSPNLSGPSVVRPRKRCWRRFVVWSISYHASCWLMHQAQARLCWGCYRFSSTPARTDTNNPYQQPSHSHESEPMMIGTWSAQTTKKKKLAIFHTPAFVVVVTTPPLTDCVVFPLESTPIFSSDCSLTLFSSLYSPRTKWHCTWIGVWCSIFKPSGLTSTAATSRQQWVIALPVYHTHLTIHHQSNRVILHW